MAKRKKHHKKAHSKRRHSKMGAIDMQNILGVVAGAFTAGYLDKIIPATIDKKITSAGKIALGVLLPNLAKGGKMKSMLAGVGSGMIAVGTVNLLQGFGVLSGDDDMLEVSLNGDQDILAGGEDVLAGDDDLSVVNGDNDLSVVNGMDEDEY